MEEKYKQWYLPERLEKQKIWCCGGSWYGSSNCRDAQSEDNWNSNDIFGVSTTPPCLLRSRGRSL